MPHPIANAYRAVCANIAQACGSAGRPADSVTLVVVSKTQEATAIRSVLTAGQRVFGENRVQEARQKWPKLKADFADVELHLIGPLQTNKAAEAVAFFDVIQSVDRDRLVAKLAAEMAHQGRQPKLLAQVNTGNEPQKAGIAPTELSAFLDRAWKNHGVTFSGLMCIPPADDDPSAHFQMLADLAKVRGLTTLSMGMSADFGQAIAAGATHVRVGSAIFGARPVAHPVAAKPPTS